MKMLTCLTLSVALHAGAFLALAKSSKTVRLADGEVAQINTAVGYSTILQFDARPSSAVLGDQDAFKVEYVGTALTIKPVIPGAKTNLFVFTDYERFNFRLVTGSPSGVDYTVRVTRRGSGDVSQIPSEVEVIPDPVSESFQTPPEGRLITRTSGKAAKCGAYSLYLESIAYPEKKPWLILNFNISSSSGREEEIDPAAIQVFEGRTALDIENLYLESVKVPGSGAPVHGTAMLKRKNPTRTNGLTLVLSLPRQPQRKCSEMRIPLGAGAPAKGVVNGVKAKN